LVTSSVSEGGARSSKGKPRHAGRNTRRRNGGEVHGGEDGDDEDGNGDDGTTSRAARHVTGPLSKEAMQEIRQFGQQTADTAEALALKFNKSTCSIMMAAGLSVEHSRHGENFSNKFKTWYSHQHPIPKDSGYYLNDLPEYLTNIHV
jgi:hypothetical protein